MSPAPVIHVSADPAASTADAVIEALARVLARGGRARIAVSGGRTPEAMFERLAARAEALDWHRVDVFFADERAVPPTDPESNYRMVARAFTPLAGAPRLHRMRADREPLEDAADEYAAELTAPLDVVVLGMGADGHTASLFPGSPLAGDGERRVAVVRDSPKPPRVRMTLLPRAIREAGLRLMLVTGADKAAAVARALEGEPDPVACPAQLARDGTWFMDREAAAGVRFADGRRLEGRGRDDG